MDRKEFDEIVDEIAGCVGETVTELSVKWSTGGVTGGSCWDDGTSSHYATEGEVEPEFEELDIILEKVCPSMTYLQYKALGRLIKCDTYTEHEYYGNSTNCATKTLQVEELWEFLTDHGYGA